MDLDRPVVGVGALLFRADGAVLLGHRIKEEEPESWCLPGGKVEAGESFEEAAVREIAEEAGIHGVQDAAVFVLLLDAHANSAQVTVGVVARVEDARAATPEPEVFDRWIWADPDDLPSPLFPASAALLDAWRRKPRAPQWVLYAAARLPSESQRIG